MSNKLVHYFPESDLRSGHTGLAKLAQKARVSVSALNPGDFLLFVNRKQTAFKVLTANNILAHYKSPSGRVDLGAVQYMSAAFSGGEFNFDRALYIKLEKDLARRK